MVLLDTAASRQRPQRHLLQRLQENDRRMGVRIRIFVCNCTAKHLDQDLGCVRHCSGHGSWYVLKLSQGDVHMRSVGSVYALRHLGCGPVEEFVHILARENREQFAGCSNRGLGSLRAERAVINITTHDLSTRCVLGRAGAHTSPRLSGLGDAKTDARTDG
jgi:hypothetical protein